MTHYLRQPEGHWLRSDIEGLEREVPLLTLGQGVPLREIYMNVEFTAAS